MCVACSPAGGAPAAPPQRGACYVRAMPRTFRDDLDALGLRDGNDLDATEIDEALDQHPWPATTRTLRRRPLLRVERLATGPFSGDETDIWWLLFRPDDEAYVWWSQPYSGLGVGVFIGSGNPAEVQRAIASKLDEFGWSLGQFVGTTIQNEAPDVLPRGFFMHLLREAEARHPLRLVDLDTDAMTLEDWLNANYTESDGR